MNCTLEGKKKNQQHTGADLAWGLGVRQPPLHACTSRKYRGGMRGRRREERRRGGAGGGRRMSAPLSMNPGSVTACFVPTSPMKKTNAREMGCGSGSEQRSKTSQYDRNVTFSCWSFIRPLRRIANLQSIQIPRKSHK